MINSSITPGQVPNAISPLFIGIIAVLVIMGVAIGVYQFIKGK